RTSFAGLDRGAAQRGRRPLALEPPRAIPAADRPAADAITHQLAHAARLEPAARDQRQADGGGAGCRLRERGRLLAGVQARLGPVTGSVAEAEASLRRAAKHSRPEA